MTEHVKYDLDAEMAAMRTPIDAKWSAGKKRIVGAVCVMGAAAAIGAGVWAATSLGAPALPKSANEALAVMASDRYDKLDDERKRQYAAEAQRLFRELSDEERRRLMEDEKAREAMRAMREEMFDDMARRFARGDEMPFSRRGDGPPRRPPGQQQGERPRQFQEMTEEERAAARERMREQANERVNEQVESGNAQSGGLRSEMMKRRFGGGGGGGRPGGGGGRPRG